MSSGILEEDKILEIVTQWKASPIVRHYSFSDKKLWSYGQLGIIRGLRSGLEILLGKALLRPML